MHICLHVHMEPGGCCQVFPWLILFWDKVVTEPEASIRQSLASQEAPGFPCFYPHSAGFTDACNGTENRIQVLMLLQQALCQLSYLLSPLFIITLFYHWVIPPVLNYLIVNPNNFLLPGWLLVLSLTCYIGLNHQFNFLQPDFLFVKYRLWDFYKRVVRTHIKSQLRYLIHSKCSVIVSYCCFVLDQQRMGSTGIRREAKGG